MCGLVGLAGDLEFKDENTMRRLLLIDYVRGSDSTGLAAVRTNGETHLTKIASHPIDLFDSSKFKKTLTGYNSSIFLGHNRAATLGKVNTLNAHPFEYDHIIGAHNGTLDRESWSRLEDVTGEKTDVDSAAIFAAIAKVGIEETIKLMETGTTSQRGAWALTWYNAEDKTINFLRNKHRPLWYCYTKDFKKIMWASQYPMLSAAIRLGKLDDYELYTNKDGSCYFEFKQDWWYRFKLDDLIAGKDKRPIGRVKKLEGREPKVYSYTSTTSVGDAPFQGPNGTGATSTSTRNGGRTPWAKDTNQFTIFGTKENPWAGYFTEFQFSKIGTSQYCAWCGEPITYNDVGIAVYEGANVMLCSDHSGNEGHNRVYASPPKFNEFSSNVVA